MQNGKPCDAVAMKFIGDKPTGRLKCSDGRVVIAKPLICGLLFALKISGLTI